VAALVGGLRLRLNPPYELVGKLATDLDMRASLAMTIGYDECGNVD